MKLGEALVDIAFTAAEKCCRGVARSRGVFDSVDDSDAAAFDMVTEGDLETLRLILQSIPGGGETKKPLLE